METNEDQRSWQEPALSGLGLPRRAAFRAMRRGFACRCPACGDAPLFRNYLKPVLACGACDEDLSHQRADDAPPYFTMLIVGHLLIPLMIGFVLATDLSNITHMMIWIPLAIVMTLALLQPVKGVIIGLQWALYMHGFDTRSDPDAAPEGFLPRDAAADSV
jgi:uncharacterized protein (DUF983 family)